MDYDELDKLIQVFDKANLTELEIEEDGRRIRLARNHAIPVVHPVTMEGAVHVPVHEPAARPGQEPPARSYEDEGLVTVDSPMVGTFYNSPQPGEAPFVLAGDTVEPGQVVCIVEAMKILNEVTAKFPAIIEKVLVENGEPVEYGQPLFAVRPLA